MQFHVKFPKSFFALILFLIAFILLVLAAVLPFVYKETVFINNSYFGGKSYPSSTQVTTGANTVNSNLVDFRNRYKDFIKTFYFGIFFYCVKTEINYYAGKYYGGYSVQSINTPISGGPKIEIGTSCYQYEWYSGKDLYKTNEFADYMYTESISNNNTIVIAEVDVSTPGFPGGSTPNPNPFPGNGGGGGGGSTTTQPSLSTKPIYDMQGESQFLENVNVHTFNALRVFVIFALIISFIILIKLVVLAILHCLHFHSHEHSKKHRKLLKFLHFLLWALIIVWKIILVLLLVIYYEIIHFLIMQVKALSIFAIGFAFWFFWIGFIFILIVWVILHFHHKFLKCCKPDHHPHPPPPHHPCPPPHHPPHHPCHPPHHYEMTPYPNAYPPITIAASASASAAASAAASSSAGASNSLV